MKKYLYIMLILAITLLSSCANIIGGPDTSRDTILFEKDSEGFVTFRTCDVNLSNKTYIKPYPSTYLMHSTITATVAKNSGNANVPFGVVYAYQNSQNFRYVVITKNGYYRWSIVNNGVEGRWPGYQYNSGIHTGNEASNTITITYDFDLDRYYLQFNDNNYCESEGGMDPSKQAGYCGFICSVGTATEESLPNSIVEYKFSMKRPVTIPE
jgi:hypothetical protein